MPAPKRIRTYTRQPNLSATDVSVLSDGMRPTGAIAETFSRVNYTGGAGPIFSARVFGVAIRIPAGKVISNITFISGSTPAGTPLNQWFGLCNSSRAVLRLTADDTSTAWAASTAKTLTLSSPYTTTYSGLHYLAIMVKATTVPTLWSAAMGDPVINGVPPVLYGRDDTTINLTNPASCPDPIGGAGFNSTFFTLPYAYVS